MCWENKCIRCGKEFDTCHPQLVCNGCWTSVDYEEEYKKQEESWKNRAEVAERKLLKLPKWLVKIL